MGNNLTTSEKFAKELVWCVSFDFFSVKELKSVAASIDWPLGFFNFSNKLKLKEQMTYLCAFLGQTALKFSATLDLLDKDFVARCSILYIEKLTCRWLLQSDIPKCKEKVSSWESLGLLDAYAKLNECCSDEVAEPYAEIIQRISEDFYESLTQRECKELHKWCLYRRFNLYFGRFIEIINAVAKKNGML